MLEHVFNGDEDESKEPEHPGDDANRDKLLKWELEMRDHHENKKLSKEGLFSLWPQIKGQASELTVTKLKSTNDFKEKEKKRDCKWLLDNLRRVTNKTEPSTHPIKCIVDTRRTLCTHMQSNDQTLMDYVEQL